MNSKSIMWDYIDEEPSLLLSLLKTNDLDEKIQHIKTYIKNIYIVAHGSSYNAALCIAPFIRKISTLKVSVHTPADFMYNTNNILLENPFETIVLAISQTGTSRGVLEAVKFARNLGFEILGLTNERNSLLDNTSDVTMFLKCGEEDSNAKTKGVSCTLLQLMLFSMKYALLNNKISQTYYSTCIEQLENEISYFSNIKEQALNCYSKVEIAKDIQNLYVLGYGMNFATAMECQLKIIETMNIPSMYNDIVEFSHGMHRAINENSCIILLHTKDNEMSKLTLKTYEYLKKITTKVILINASDELIKEENVIQIPYFEIDSSVLLITLAIQILSVYIPEYYNKDPNRNSNDDYTNFVATRLQ